MAKVEVQGALILTNSSEIVILLTHFFLACIGLFFSVIGYPKNPLTDYLPARLCRDFKFAALKNHF